MGLRDPFRPVIAGIGALALLSLAACDTQPATNVTWDGATLNSKGACPGAGHRGTNQYQIRDVTRSTPAFKDVGARHRFDCTAKSGETALPSERVGGLMPGRRYQYRLVTRLDNGSVVTWDSKGTQNGTAWDAFTTPAEPVIEEVTTTEEIDPAPSDDPVAAGCPPPKRITNTRKGRSGIFGTHLWTIELRSRWRYCRGRIIRLEAPVKRCFITEAAGWLGYRCVIPDENHQLENGCSGGNPEHCNQIFWWIIHAKIDSDSNPYVTRNWCAGNQMSGSGAYRMHGSCSIQPW
jgi:hypothetical protein